VHVSDQSGRGRDDAADWERKRRLARIFGDVLPDTTRDEREDERDDRTRTADDWLRSQVPPHHGS
jgi:hypothetical protein